MDEKYLPFVKVEATRYVKTYGREVVEEHHYAQVKSVLQQISFVVEE